MTSAMPDEEWSNGMATSLTRPATFRGTGYVSEQSNLEEIVRRSVIARRDAIDRANVPGGMCGIRGWRSQHAHIKQIYPVAHLSPDKSRTPCAPVSRISRCSRRTCRARKLPHHEGDSGRPLPESIATRPYSPATRIPMTGIPPRIGPPHLRRDEAPPLPPVPTRDDLRYSPRYSPRSPPGGMCRDIRRDIRRDRLYRRDDQTHVRR